MSTARDPRRNVILATFVALVAVLLTAGMLSFGAATASATAPYCEGQQVLEGEECIECEECQLPETPPPPPTPVPPTPPPVTVLSCSGGSVPNSDNTECLPKPDAGDFSSNALDGPTGGGAVLDVSSIYRVSAVAGAADQPASVGGGGGGGGGSGAAAPGGSLPYTGNGSTLPLALLGLLLVSLGSALHVAAGRRRARRVG